MRGSRATVMAVLIASMATACATAQPPMRQADGSLASCDAVSLCVSSQATSADNRIEPLRYADAEEVARKRLLKILVAVPRVRFVVNVPNYVHVEVMSPVTGHINDVEFLFAAGEARIDMRAASRGSSLASEDNRARLEAIRQAFAAP